MRDVAERYGYEPNRAGFISCPFHSDKTPSIKVYNDIGKGFYCFGCGAGGSVIDFAMKLFDISFQQAIARLSFDFGIPTDCHKPSGREFETFKRKKAQEVRELAEYQRQYMDKVRLHRSAVEILKSTQNPQTDQEAQSKAWALSTLEHTEFWLSEHPWR